MGKGRSAADRVLVVEDDEDVRAVLAESLRDEGHEVTAADFGPLPDGEFEVVLTDVPTWPYRSDETRRWIRLLRDRYADSRIILCTAQRIVHRESDELGADGIVDMPFDLGELFARVADLVRRPVLPRAATLSCAR